MQSLTLALGAALLVSACGKKTEGDGKTEPASSGSTPGPAEQLVTIGGNAYYKAADGSVKAWGFSSGLADGKETRNKPEVVAELANTKRLATGGGQTMCVVVNDGTVKCWGNGASGELGDGKAGESPKPVVVPGVAKAVDVVLGSYYACALIADGTVSCWGNNGYNQVSVDAKKTLVTPTIMPGVAGATQIAAGGSTTCALESGGTVKCWGLACGADGPNLCVKPFTVAAWAGATSIAAGWESACAVTKDSGVSCFGDNDSGQLGNGTTERSETGKLTQVKGLTGVSSLAAGQEHWCALMKNGTVQCWGSNEFGQLGDGTLPDGDKNKVRATPAPVKGVTDAVALTCGGGSCCAQIKDKSLKCWGENNGGMMFGAANSGTERVATALAVPL